MGDMNYAPNSHKFKEEQKNPAPMEKRVPKVVKGTVKTKKNEMRKWADIFISEDVSSVKSYIFMDVLVPAIKKAIYDIVTNGIDMFLYGGSGRSKNGPSGTKVSYQHYYDQKNNAPTRHTETAKNNNNVFDYDDIVFVSRGDAEAVKQQMQGAIVKYGFVTVADLYDMVDQTPPYTSNKYGWIDVSNAEVIRYRGDYRLKLPKAAPID